MLFDLREAHDLTQEELCTRTGIPYNTYRRYEYEETFPKAEAIISLARLYNLLTGELFQMLVDDFCSIYPRKDELRSELDKYRKWLKRPLEP